MINGKIYIGKKKGSEFCFDYKGSGSILRLAINKYGKENFYVEPLVVCFSLEELNAEEEFLIDWFNARDPKVGYNRAKGGAGGGAEGRKWSEESRINLSLRISGEGNPNFGKSRSPETRRKISEANKGNQNWLGKKHSVESIAKMKEASKNKKYRKVCQNCGIEFLAKGTRTKYCDNCRKEV